jgi:hypothetical protein
VIEHAGEARALQGKDSQFGKEFLLADALAERAARQVIGLFVGRWRFNDRFFMVRQLAHNPFSNALGSGLTHALRIGSAPKHNSKDE